MKFPICSVCLKNEILCKGCTQFTKEQNIPKKEIELYRKLYVLMKNEEHLKDVEIKRILSNKDFALIVTIRNDVSKIIGKNGITAKKLSKDLKKQIRVIADTFNIEEFSKEILFSTPILGINVVYTPNSEKYRIRIPSSERVLLPISPEDFSQLASTIFKNEVELVFE